MEKASGLRSLPLLAEGRHRPLTGCPLGPPWGAVFGLVLVPGRVPGLKPRSSLRLGSQCFVQAFCRGDTWHLRLWVLPVLSAFNFTFLLSFSFFFFSFLALNHSQGDQAQCLLLLPSCLFLDL